MIRVFWNQVFSQRYIKKVKAVNFMTGSDIAHKQAAMSQE
jgi:hypothetical protein